MNGSWFFDVYLMYQLYFAVKKNWLLTSHCVNFLSRKELKKMYYEGGRKRRNGKKKRRIGVSREITGTFFFSGKIITNFWRQKK